MDGYSRTTSLLAPLAVVVAVGLGFLAGVVVQLTHASDATVVASVMIGVPTLVVLTALVIAGVCLAKLRRTGRTTGSS